MRRTGVPLLAAAGGGLAVALAFPDYDIWPLVWIAYVPLFFFIKGASFRRAFLLSLVAGSTANFIGFFWMVNMLNQFGHLPYWLSVVIMFFGALYQGLSIALAFALTNLVATRKRWPFLAVAPLLYTGLEAVHPILFPWFLGNCQYRWLHLTQVCDLAGISAITFLVVAGNAALFDTLWALRVDGLRKSRMRTFVPGIVFLGLLGLVLLYGHVRLGQVRTLEADAQKLKLAVIEPEIGIFEEQAKEFPEDAPPLWLLKWNSLRLHWTSRELARNDVDLIVWPESTYFPALTVHAKRSRADWLVTGEDRVQIVEDRYSGFQETAARTGLRAAASRGSESSYLVGDDCSVFRLDGVELAREETACRADLHAVYFGCRGGRDLRDTPHDQCIAKAAGDHGTVIVRTANEWVQLATDLTHDLHTITGFAATDFVVAGDGIIARGTLESGVLEKVETKGVSWVKALRGSRTILIVSRDGRLATVSLMGDIQLVEKPVGVSGVVNDAAISADSRLLLAGEHGLHTFAAGKLEVLDDSRPYVSVACTPDGECAALAADGGLFEVRGSAVTRRLDLPPNRTGLAPVPFSRYYWWLPPDVQRLYVAPDNLPEDRTYPAAVEEDEAIHERDVNAVQRGFSAPLLFGATSGDIEKLDEPNSLANTRFNSAFLADETGRVMGRYDKQYLLAFGEYIPWGDVFPILYEWSPSSGRFQAGPNRRPVRFKGHNLGILICYEDIIPGHTNEVAAAGAHVLINLTNDAWFGKTKEAYQHFVLASFRAIEQRLVLVRATTTGVSGVVSATGGILHMTGAYDAETFTASVPLLESDTIYRAGGRYFDLAALLVAMCLLVWTFRDSRSGRRRSASEAPSPRP